jgi:hypothetical protein
MYVNWVTDTEYKVGDKIKLFPWEDHAYECLRDHKSNVFADELFGKHTAQKTVEKAWKKVSI